MKRARVAWVFLALGVCLRLADAASLRGSRGAMIRQSAAAVRLGFVALESETDVQRLVGAEALVLVSPGRDLDVDGAEFPYARPQLRTFVRELARAYRGACGERLVVTSLTRPLSRQPENASALSVHPMGLAADLRRSSRTSCRRWLEARLLRFERAGAVEATVEHFPPHYHVAILPRAPLRPRRPPSARAIAATVSPAVTAKAVSAQSEAVGAFRTVRSGECLWSIARELGIPARVLRRINGLQSTRLRPGQQLRIPAASRRNARGAADAVSS